MEPRVKSALLWGLVGGLTVLVLAWGAVALEMASIPLAPAAAVALAVTVVTAGLTYRYERRLIAWASERGR